MTTYLRILRYPGLAALMSSVLIARLPVGINGLALVLFLREETGSFSVPGAVAGALALGLGAGAPFMGRLVDSVGTRVLLPLAAGHAVGVLGLLALGAAGAPAAALVAVALVTGALFPPNPAVMRGRFPWLLRRDPDLIPAAYALDSVLLEIAFIAGPLVTAALVTLLQPAAALVFSAASIVAGTLVFVAALPADVDPERRSEHHGFWDVLRTPGITTLVMTMLPVGFAIGALEVTLPAFGDEHGSASWGGVLLAIWSLGSAAAGFAYGLRARRGTLADAHLRLTLLMPLAFVPMLLAPSVLAMAVLVLPAGLFIAPLIATRNELAQQTAPPGTKTEALTWPVTALVSGVAFGAAAGGALIDGSGWRSAVVAAVLAAALAGLVALARRGTLEAAVA